MKSSTAQYKVYAITLVSTKPIVIYIGSRTDAATKDEKRWLK